MNSPGGVHMHFDPQTAINCRRVDQSDKVIAGTAAVSSDYSASTKV